jgi:hypothetical protein
MITDKKMRRDLLRFSTILNDIKKNEARGRCSIRWCTSGLPAEHLIPVPDLPPPPNALFVRVTDNCYYDYKYEGIQIY